MDYHKQVFSKVDYRILIFVTPILGLLLLPAVMNIPLGIDFTGGTETQILTEKDLTPTQLESALSQCADQPLDINVQGLDDKTSAIVRSKSEMSEECIHSGLSGIGFTEKELESVIPSTFKPELGTVLMEQGSNVIMIAGTLMMIIVFIVFRSIIPSLAVIQAAVFDIIIALGILSILGFELNLAGVAALLMLIGYSVDTDIMLTSKILKQTSKDFAQSANQAFSTGITMTGTTLAAMTAIFIVASFIRMDTMVQIAAVILAGLVADLPTTWLTNLAILRWYSGRAKSGPGRFKFSIFRQ